MQKDKFDRFLTPGSFVIYGIRSGNSGGVRYGLILSSLVDPKEQNWNQRVRVLAPGNYSKGFTVSRPSTDNMIKVPDGTFPEEIEEALTKEWHERIEKNAQQEATREGSVFPSEAAQRTNRTTHSN